MSRDPAELEIPIVATLLLHALLAGGLFAAKDCRPEPELLAGADSSDELIDFAPERTQLPDVELPKPKVEPPEPPEEPPEEPQEITPPDRPPPARTQPTRDETPRAPPKIVESEPAPGPADSSDESAPTFKLPAQGSGGSIPVPAGTPPPKGPYGSGGKGTGTGGGGPPDSKGTAPAPVSVAAIKRRAMPIGDTDFLDIGKNYPPEAKRRGIEGTIKVRLVVDEKGRVTSRKLVTRLGYGLDQLALELAKKLEFEPAIDTSDRPVTSIVVWTFNFTLPG